MQRIKPVEGETYYIFNRGVDNQIVFKETDDYFRFTHDLWEFNDWAPAPNIFYRKKSLDTYEVKPRKDFQRLGDKQKGSLVEVLAFCLLPGGFHLVLRQLVENGITDFMQKIGTGYTVFFNQKYKRSGRFFEGPYKIKHLKNREQFLAMIYYLHSIPLDLKFPKWRQGKFGGISKALEFLGDYRWSSHADYCGQKKWPAIISSKVFKKNSGDGNKYRKNFERWLEEFKIEKIKDLTWE